MERDGQLELYRVVADRLKEAHARIAGLALSAEDRTRLSRRLLTVTAAAKHDLAGAVRRLDSLLEELDSLRPPRR
jgi:hypothetical protein